MRDLENLYESFITRPCKSTILSRMPPLLRFSVIIALLVAFPFLRNYVLVIAVAAVTITLAYITGKLPNIIKMIKGLKWLITLTAVAALTAYAVRGGFNLAEAGIYAVTFIAKLLVFFTVFNMLVTSFTLTELVSLAKTLKIPVSITYSFILTLRFIPLILHDMVSIDESLRMKGMNLKEGGALKKLRNLPLLLTPLLVITTYRVDKVAESIELRNLLSG